MQVPAHGFVLGMSTPQSATVHGTGAVPVTIRTGAVPDVVGIVPVMTTAVGTGG